MKISIQNKLYEVKETFLGSLQCVLVCFTEILTEKEIIVNVILEDESSFTASGLIELVDFIDKNGFVDQYVIKDF